MIGDPKATWGITRGNPIWEEMLEAATMANPSFLLNVAMNSDKQITGVFAGDMVVAHAAGCRFVKKHAMAETDEPFDIVITSNSGYIVAHRKQGRYAIGCTRSTSGTRPVTNGWCVPKVSGISLEGRALTTASCDSKLLGVMSMNPTPTLDSLGGTRSVPRNLKWSPESHRRKRSSAPRQRKNS